jgi:hypothetical protein
MESKILLLETKTGIKVFFLLFTFIFYTAANNLCSYYVIG